MNRTQQTTLLTIILLLLVSNTIKGHQVSLLWSLQLGRKCITIWYYTQCHPSPILSISISSNGNYIVAGSANGKVYLLNKEGKIVWGRNLGWVWSLDTSDAADYIVVSSGNNVYFFSNSGIGYPLHWISHVTFRGDVLSVAISSDGSYVAAGSDDGKVYFLSSAVNRAPIAGFRFEPSSPTDLDVISFVDESYDPDGRVVRWLWEFGDGVTSTERSPRHRYANDRAYTVRLTVWDDKGASSTATKTIIVRNVEPSASFMYEPSKPYAGQGVVFDASKSSDPDGHIASYEWDFNGDGHVDARGVKVSYVYDEPGSYTVRLTVVDDDGAKASAERKVNILRRELPDLVVNASIPRAGVELRALNVSFAVSNVGLEGSEGFTVALLVDENAVDEVSVGYLSPNSTAKGVLVWALPSQGIHSLKVCADPGGVVEELDEGNNCFEGSVEVAPRPRLEVSAPEGLRLEANGTGVLRALVRNVGRVWARGVEVSLALPEGVEPLTPLAKRLGDLGPGELAEVEWGLRALSPGEHVAEIRVKALDMPETKAYVTIHVSMPVSNIEAKLKVVALQVIPYKVRISSSFRISFAIENIGKVKAEEVKARVLLQPGVKLAEGELPYKELGDIAPSESKDVVWSLVGIEEGEYAISIRITSSNANEENAMVKVMVVKPPRLLIRVRLLNMTWHEVSEIEVGEGFRLEAIVYNRGGIEATDVTIVLDLSYAAEGLRLAPLEKAVRRVSLLEKGESVSLTWVLEAIKSGSYWIKVLATSPGIEEVYDLYQVRVKG